LLQLGKTVIIKEAFANGRTFNNENSNHQSFIRSYMAKKYQVGTDAAL
jgi:hypothetical protein